jgi:hypothetical protein
LSLFVTKPEEAGERMLYYGTSEQYATGSKILDSDGTEKAEKVLVEYRERGIGDVVMEHNQKIFERATSN